MPNLLSAPPHLPLIAPSILSADFANMERDCRLVLSAGSSPLDRADLLHLDVMDGHFVPNLTMGPDMCRALRRAFPDIFLDVHLMVTDPWLHAQAFSKAGASHITFHVEVAPPANLINLAQRIRALAPALSVGLAINPPTPVESILPLVEHFDLILVMSVNPGRSGQAFIPDVLSKVRLISQRLSPNQRLQMDGGINPSNAPSCLNVGCDVIVAASAIFNAPPDQRPSIIRSLRSAPSSSRAMSE